MAGSETYAGEWIDIPFCNDILNRAVHLAPPMGYCMEFGVYEGGSLRNLCKLVAPRLMFGFDSFIGLPEPWQRDYSGTVYETGHFHVGRIPKGLPENARIVEGYFEDTLRDWLASHPGIIALVHIDSDLYSSAKTVLTAIKRRLISGSTILFDELFGYEAWPEGEYKALQEWDVPHNRLYRQKGGKALIQII